MTAITSKSLCEVILKELHRQRDSGSSPFVQDFDGDFRCISIVGDIDLIALAEVIERHHSEIPR